MNAQKITLLFIRFYLFLGLVCCFQLAWAQNQCTDPIATLQFDNNASNDDCCWFVNINNQNISNQITAIQFHNFVDCQIGTLTPNGTWTINNLSTTDAIVQPNTAFIQPGVYNQQVRICLANRTVLPHFFDFSFLETDANGVFQTFCSNTFAIDCPISNCLNSCPNGLMELVSNGDFSQGDVGFNSSLNVNCNCASGTYCVTNDARNKCNNSQWNMVLAPGGAGNFLVIDGAVGSVWSQSVNVTSGNNYTFSFDFYPDISDDPSPTMAMVIDGNVVQNNIVGTAGTWNTYCVDWQAPSPSPGSVTLEIRQTNSAGFDDYGIDNVSFSTCCDLSIVLSDTLSFCDDVFAQLSPTITGASGTVAYSWSPASGLSNPNIANPTANPSTTTTYTLTATDASGCVATASTVVEPVFCPCDNLILNGDFESGDTGFGSTLNSNCSCVTSYCITTNARNKCNNSLWQNILAKDGIGNYMVIDGSTAATIWSQNVNVTAGEMYHFRFDYFPNVSGGGTPQLQVDVYNGASLIATLGTTSGISGMWENVILTGTGWTSPLSGNVELRISQLDSPQYSDYGIDNLVFTCNDAILGVTDPQFSTSVSLFPNPVDDVVTIQLADAVGSDLQYELFDLMGRQIRRGQINRGVTQVQINMSNFPEGVYLLLLGNTQEGYHREKIVKRQ